MRVAFFQWWSRFVAVAENMVFVSNIQGLVESKTSLNEFWFIDCSLTFFKLFELLEDWLNDPNYVRRNSICVNGVNANAVVTVTIKSIKDEL